MTGRSEYGAAYLVQAAHANVDLQEADGQSEEDGVAQAHTPAQPMRHDAMSSTLQH